MKGIPDHSQAEARDHMALGVGEVQPTETPKPAEVLVVHGFKPALVVGVVSETNETKAPQ